MGKIKDLTGMVYGRLTVISFSHRSSCNQYYWDCLCICGNKTKVVAGNINNGHTKSCGCLSIEKASERAITHNQSKSLEHKSWRRMKTRCLNVNTPGFKNWGGRGITICDRWLNSFENFFADMGIAPSSKHSLDRIDNNGNYEPGNCRWATIIEQANNRRTNNMIEYNGETKSLSMWCVELSIKYERTRIRISKGWSAENAFTTP